MSVLKPVQEKQSLSQSIANYSLKQFVALYVLMFPFLAHAAKEPGIGIIDKVIDLLQGGYARGFAIIALCVLGYTCFWAQKIEVRKAAYIAIAIVLIFGAAEFADLFIDEAS